MTTATHLLVANPVARSGRNAARIERALCLLDAAGLKSRLLATEPGGRTAAAVRAALREPVCRCVVTMGGDGTFREAAEGLLGSGRGEEVTLGMLPAGTANNHGNTFGLEAGESALQRNVEIIAAGRETRLDAGELHAEGGAGETITRATFFDSVGWGIGAAVIAARNAALPQIRRLGPIARVYRDESVYGGALLTTLLRTRRSEVDAFASVVVDGERRELGRLAELLVRGTRVYSGGWVVDPTSRHDDGMFEVIPFRTRRDWLSRAAIGLHGGRLVRAGLASGGPPPGTMRGSRIDVRFDLREGAEPPPGQMDGDELPRAERVSIEVVPRAVRLIVP